MSTGIVSNKTPDITAEACAWIAQLETGNMSAADLSALKEWVERSPRHFQELRKIAQLSGDTNILTEMAGTIGAAGKERSQTVAANKSGLGGWGRPAMAALAIIVLAIGAGFMDLRQGVDPVVEPYIISTSVGEFEEHILADGSLAKLNTDSQIEVDFGEIQRRVRL